MTRGFCCLLLISLLTTVASAQVSANMTGTVVDPNSSAVTDAAVTAQSLETGLTRDTTTNQYGRYQLLALPVGTYQVSVRKRGFAEEIRTGVRLVVGQDAAVNVRLRIGEVTQQIKVSGDAELVSTSTQDISGLVGEQQIKDLPLNGRSYDLLMTLNPGVVNFTSRKDRRHWSLEFHYRQQLRRLRQSSATEYIPAEWRGVYRCRRKQYAARRHEPAVARCRCRARI